MLYVLTVYVNSICIAMVFYYSHHRSCWGLGQNHSPVPKRNAKPRAL